MQKERTEAVIIENLHRALRLMVSNLKADQKKLKKLSKETENVGSVLQSSLDDALFHYERAISCLEEEIDS